MIKNPLNLVRNIFIKTAECEYSAEPRATRVLAGSATEFIFCNRKFGAVIVDASHSGMKLSCELRLGIGSIINLVEPAISAKIIWRDDEKNLMGIKFVRNESRSLALEAAS